MYDLNFYADAGRERHEASIKEREHNRLAQIVRAAQGARANRTKAVIERIIAFTKHSDAQPATTIQTQTQELPQFS